MFVPRRLANLFHNIGLWPRLAFVITVGFLIFFTIFSLLSMRMVNDSTGRILNERQILTQMAADEIDALLAQSFYELEKATTFAKFDPQADNLEEEYHMLAHAYGRVGAFSLGVYFYDATGKVVLAEPYDAFIIGADHSAKSHIRQVIESGQRSVSPPFLQPNTNVPAVALTIPIRNDRGQLISMLSGLIDLSSPNVRRPIEQALNLGHTGHAELVDSQGNVLVSTYPETFLQPGEHATFYREMMAESLVGVKTVPYEDDGDDEAADETMHVMAFVPLSMADWGIALGGDATETFASVTTLRNSLFLLGGLMLVIILAATLMGTRRLVRPVKALTESAQRIAKGDLTSAIQLSEGGEIGLLEGSLEEMRVRLKGSIDETQRWNQELEQRVKYRTKELEELYQQLLEQNKERGVLLKKIISAQEEERYRLARELHDETAQTIGALSISLDRARDGLENNDTDTMKHLLEAKAITMRLLEETRRLILDLRPQVLDDLGLGPSIRWYAETHLGELGMEVTVETELVRLPEHIEVSLFRVIQEAVNNIGKHANAKHVHIHLSRQDSKVSVMINDDGKGFNVERVMESSVNGSNVGILGMQERVRLLNGSIQFHSQEGAGTEIFIDIPLLEEPV